MNKEIVIVAFPQAALKVIVFNGMLEKVSAQDAIEDCLCWQPDLIKTLNHMMEKYSDITTINLLGPAAYTQGLLTILSNEYADNEELTIMVAEV